MCLPLALDVDDSSAIMAATRHSGAVRLVHDAGMALPPFNETASPSALAEELERMLDRGVPPLGDRAMGGGQSVFIARCSADSCRRPPFTEIQFMTVRAEFMILLVVLLAGFADVIIHLAL